MKKSIIALAIAGAMTVPMVAQADATLFGEIRYDITDVDGDNTNSNISRVRIGVKGEETMDNGLTAGYFIRYDAKDGANGNVSLHKSTVYVAGDFGKVVMGDTDNPNQSVEDRTEYGLYSGELTVVDTEFSGGGIAYESNNINGFKFAAGMGNVDQKDNSVDNSSGIMVSYDTDTFGVTVGAGQNKGANNKSNYGISASAKLAGFDLGARYSVQKVNAGTDIKGYALGGSYAVDKLTFSLQHESRKTGSLKEKAFSASVDYALGGNATVTLAALSVNKDAEAERTPGKNDGSKDQVKLRYKITF
ncbi:MAG: hypothetical protein OFPII_16640 [Osedax symbiont Rs1]|nr:MAG: hypothetical protein OFPII_16640 [Osedax symbiont Rs1]